MNPQILAAAALLLATTLPAMASEIFVSPHGDDRNPGSAPLPIATLERAQKLARVAQGKGPVNVVLAGGTYYLSRPLLFTTEDSGSQTAPITYRAAKGQKPVISGGQKLELKWEPFRDGIYQAKTAPGLVTDQLFVNGTRQSMARYPNFDVKAPYFDGSAADAISPERVAKWANPAGGFFHAMHPALWGGFSFLIKGKKPDGALDMEGGWQNNRGKALHAKIRFVENIFEELDAPGEWFHDASSNTLYFYPPSGCDLQSACVEVTTLKSLVELRGTEHAPVRFIRFEGITFCQTLRTMMETKEPLLRTDWALYRGGAIYFEGAEDCSLVDCFIDQVGGNAVFVNAYNRRIEIKSCQIAKAGANGIAFVGDPKAARAPLFNYDQRQSLTGLDRTPGPKTSNYPADCLVDDCLIYLTGRVEKQTAGIEIDLAQNITIRHCSIYDMPRAGINIGDGCWGGHLIEGCDVFDTVKETGDHGSFNSWGRDRFWELKDVDLQTLGKGGANEDLPTLDVVKPITIRDSRWRCDHGWDIDLDDGSSNYRIFNNLCLNGGIKNREGYHRVVENNIMVNNGFHPHCWFPQSGDLFQKNIVFAPYKPARMPSPYPGTLDRNFLHRTGVTDVKPANELVKGSGQDAHSISGDALFVNPPVGDFSVRNDSPALQVGFKNFPMNQFGVRSPSLKAIARTPVIPAMIQAKQDLKASAGTDWSGAKVREISGEEYSAFGVGRDEGGVQVVSVVAGSAADRSGLKAGDLILAVNGEKTPRLADLLSRSGTGLGALQLGIVRNQQRISVTLQR